MDRQNAKYIGGYKLNAVETILDFYLSGEKKTDLDVKIQEWIVNGEDVAEKEKVLEKIWNKRVRESRPDLDAYMALADLRWRLGFEQELMPIKAGKPLRRMLFTRVAAVLAIGLFTGGIIFLASRYGGEAQSPLTAYVEPTPEYVTVNSGDKGRVEVALPDGSTVWLHRNSSIEYPENFEADRTVRLTGEAYFSVVKQDGKPFLVESRDFSVRVLGTEFAIESGDDARSSVEMAGGRVEVSVDERPYILNTGDRLVLDRLTGDLSLSKIAPEEAVAPWRDANLTFENCSLDAVFERLASFYDVDIEVAGRLPAKERITVQFDDDESLEGVLYIIERTSRAFAFEIGNEGKVTITGR
jgi:ferric-dicitrate binding protein FerR (iron transport regulator)